MDHSVNEVQEDEPILVSLNTETLEKLHPQLADAIRTIQAEKLGQEEISWKDFSQHSKH